MRPFFQTLKKSNTFKAITSLSICFLSIMTMVENSLNGLYVSVKGWMGFALLNGCLILISAYFTFLFLTKKSAQLQRKLRQTINKISLPVGLAILICLGLLLFFTFFVFIKPNNPLEGYFFRSFIILITGIIIALILKLHFQQESINTLFLFSILLVAFVYQAGNYLQDISSNPFSLAWSEGSRFYHASRVFSRQVYGQDIPLSFMHPSRYLLLSIPFLFSQTSIVLHRAWQVLLWIATTGLCMLALVKRLRIHDFWTNSILVLSGFIFLQQAPIYYHLLISAIVILFFFRSDRFWQSLFVVMIASFWAGISRINWYPLPGVLAALIYFFETDHEKLSLGRLVKNPFIYAAAGTLSSFAANLLYVPLSGNADIEHFTTSFNSALLWYRLLPSSTYTKGILTGILWFCTPLLLILFMQLKAVKKKTNWPTIGFLLIALVVFFLGGLVVSVKIGGGSNLHNMDAFILLLLVVIYYLSFSQRYQDQNYSNKFTFRYALLLIMLIQPIFWALNAWTPRELFSGESLQHDLDEIRGYIELVRSDDPQGEILFVNQRHLVTFGYVEVPNLVTDYELLELMEMAISNQRGYLSEFYGDLSQNRFDMIVITKQYDTIKESEQAFSEENNAWVENITIPLMEYYEPIVWLRYTDIEIYIPRTDQ